MQIRPTFLELDTKSFMIPIFLMLTLRIIGGDAINITFIVYENSVMKGVQSMSNDTSSTDFF